MKVGHNRQVSPRHADDASPEVLLHGSSHRAGWRTAQIHEAICAAFRLSVQSYALTQLRYDLRKLKGHGLLEREG